LGGAAKRSRSKARSLPVHRGVPPWRQWAARGVMQAEAQAEQLQHYISRVSVTYQKEIMRLRKIVQGLNPEALKGGPDLNNI
jgi:hypothetical protein